MNRFNTLLILLGLFFIPMISNGTIQKPDILIYKGDTISLKDFPLELLREKNSSISKRLNDTSCLSTDCWRQYIGIWEIENDSLFLIGLRDCCDYKNISLKKIFPEQWIKNQKIFADWYSGKIKAGFSKEIEYSEKYDEFFYKKQINICIANGIINELIIKEIDKN